MTDTLVTKTSKDKIGYAAPLPLERKLDGDVAKGPQPNPTPHWHVSRPMWAHEGSSMRMVTTVWPSAAWALDYMRRLPERWMTAFRVLRPYWVKFDARANGDDWVVLGFTGGSHRAKSWQCEKPNCFVGQGVED